MIHFFSPTDSFENTQDNVSRVIILTSALTVTCYAAIELFFGYHAQGAFSVAGAAIMWLSLFLFRVEKLRTLAKVLTLLAANACVFSGADWAGFEMQTQSFYFATILIPFLFFFRSRPRTLVFFGFIPIILFLIQVHIGDHFFYTPPNMNEIGFIKYLSPIFIGGIILLFLAYYRSQTLGYLGFIQKQNNAILASARMADLGVMAGGVAHEINNPLTVILLKVQRLRSEYFDTLEGREQKEVQIQQIEKTIERISEITHSLLAMSRDTSKDPYLTENLQDLLEKALKLLDSRFKQAGIHVHYRAPEERLVISARKSELGKCFVNLLLNAMEALAESEDKRIDVKVEKAGLGAKVTITDFGRGIDKEFQDKILLPFFTTKSVGDGVGLGLTLAYRTVENHQGKLYYEQMEDSTVFTVELPLQKT